MRPDAPGHCADGKLMLRGAGGGRRRSGETKESRVHVDAMVEPTSEAYSAAKWVSTKFDILVALSESGRWPCR